MSAPPEDHGEMGHSRAHPGPTPPVNGVHVVGTSTASVASNEGGPSNVALARHEDGGPLVNGDGHGNEVPNRAVQENAGYNVTDTDSGDSDIKHVASRLPATHHQNTPVTPGSPVSLAHAEIEAPAANGSSGPPVSSPSRTAGSSEMSGPEGVGHGTSGVNGSLNPANRSSSPILPVPQQLPISAGPAGHRPTNPEQPTSQARDVGDDADPHQTPPPSDQHPDPTPSPGSQAGTQGQDGDTVAQEPTPEPSGSQGNPRGSQRPNPRTLTVDGPSSGGGDTAATASSNVTHGDLQPRQHEPGSGAQSFTQSGHAGPAPPSYTPPGSSSTSSQRPGPGASLNPIAPVFVPRPGSPGTSQEFTLPPWQPDSEVSICPICGARFGMFLRRHHCRKCGRVVCDRCSPHRITIPHPYIVRPPGDPGPAPQYTYSGVERSITDFSSVGGGERVRLCNPCVPDPNTTPPQAQPSSRPVVVDGRSSRTRPPSNSLGNLSVAALPYPDHQSLSQQHNMPRNRSASASMRQGQQYLSFIPYTSASSQYPSPNSTYFSPSQFPQRRVSNSGPRYPSHIEHFGRVRGSSSSSPFSGLNRPLPRTPAPEREIPEEDACPVCHSELPSRSLSNWETLREVHINNCITSHSNYGTSQPTTVSGPVSHGTPPPRTTRRTRMFPYVATEKDCVGDTECTICLEEFKVGDQMARLECFCRFHRSCIDSWFVNHPGRCPIHQHDSFGY